MFVALRTLSLPDARKDERDEIVTALRAAATDLPGVTGCWIAAVSPVAVINAGDIVWRMTYATESEALSAPEGAHWRAAVAPLLSDLGVTVIGYRIANSQVRRQGPGIWRALVFRTFADADPAQVKNLGDATMLLPRHIAEIRSWALSPVAYCAGSKAFTYVWEQEFDSVADLTGPYMTNPVHWGIVDAYFDAEYPEYIVDPQLIQIVGTIEESIMEAVGPQEQRA